MTQPRVLFYVQYLEGIGHVVRARRIVERLCSAGCRVDLIFGGNPLPDFEAGTATIHYLPPLHASPTSYSVLLKPDGTPASDADKAVRSAALLRIFEAVAPDVVITEAYPLGRWAMDFELYPLLLRADARSDRPLILASVRDILQMPKSQAKANRSIELFDRFYDGMLIHGDPAIARIEESFPPVRAFLKKAHYTGLVVPDATVIAPRAPSTTDAASATAPDVIVSAGGGAISEAVIAAASAAKPLCRLAGAKWLALAGPRMSDAAFARLERAADANGIILERYRPDLARLMAKATLSIQRAGYNTVADALIARCRCVLIPDAADEQHEQTIRAKRLAARGAATVLAEDALTALNLATAIDRAMLTDPAPITIDTNGAARSAELVLELFRRDRAKPRPPPRDDIPKHGGKRF